MGSSAAHEVPTRVVIFPAIARRFSVKPPTQPAIFGSFDGSKDRLRQEAKTGILFSM